MFDFLLMIELLGTVAFAASGAIIAIRKKMDIFGVIVLALTTATGGGILRDVLLGVIPPSTFSNPIYAVTAVIVAVVVFIKPVRYYLTGNHRVYQRTMLIMDTLGLGLFVVSGVQLVMTMYPDGSLFLKLFIAVITGVGGGVMRDIMAGETPYIFVKDVYASAALLGGLVCELLWNVIGHESAMVCGAVAVILLRFLSAAFKWNLPRAD